MVATMASNRRQFAVMSRDRKEIYISDGLRKAIAGRNESLTTAVNLIADRYRAIVERNAPAVAGDSMFFQILKKLLAERDAPLTETEIATLPALLSDYARRKNMPTLADSITQQFTALSFAELVALVDRAERT